MLNNPKLLSLHPGASARNTPVQHLSAARPERHPVHDRTKGASEIDPVPAASVALTNSMPNETAAIAEGDRPLDPATSGNVGEASDSEGPAANPNNFGSTEEVDVAEVGDPDPGGNAEFAAEVLGSRDLEGDVLKGATWRDGHGLFATWHDKLAALAVAYIVLLHLECRGKAAITELMRHKPFAGARKPGSKKLGIIAVRLVAKPETTADHKATSDYAAMLEWALCERISPDQFIERASPMNLRDCRKFVSARVKTAKVVEGPAQHSERALTFTLPWLDGPKKRVVITLTPDQEHAVRALVEQGVKFSADDFVEAIRAQSA